MVVHDSSKAACMMQYSLFYGSFSVAGDSKTDHYYCKSFVLSSITPSSNIFLRSILITKRHDKCLRWYKWTQWLTFNYNKALSWTVNEWQYNTDCKRYGCSSEGLRGIDPALVISLAAVHEAESFCLPFSMVINGRLH